MDFERYHLYVVEGEAALAKLAALLLENTRIDIEVKAFVARNGGRVAVTSGRNLVGMCVEDGYVPPVGWKPSRGRLAEGGRFHEPDRRTKAGRSLRAEMEKLASKNAEDAATLIGASRMTIGESNPHGSGVMVRRSQCWQVGDGWFLAVPNGGDKPAETFDGCRPLKLSEFYVLKEAADAVPA